jgi:hypothetical protein
MSALWRPARFVRRDGRRLDRRATHRWVRSIGPRAGLGAVHPHMLRAAFIMAALDAGVLLRDVQLSARHADQNNHDLRPQTRELRPPRRLRRRSRRRRSVTERHFGEAPVLSASTVPSARYGTWRYGGSARVILSLIPVDIESRAAVGSQAETATPLACATHRRSVASSCRMLLFILLTRVEWFGHRLER